MKQFLKMVILYLSNLFHKSVKQVRNRTATKFQQKERIDVNNLHNILSINGSLWHRKTQAVSFLQKISPWNISEKKILLWSTACTNWKKYSFFYERDTDKDVTDKEDDDKNLSDMGFHTPIIIFTEWVSMLF